MLIVRNEPVVPSLWTGGAWVSKRPQATALPTERAGALGAVGLSDRHQIVLARAASDTAARVVATAAPVAAAAAAAAADVVVAAVAVRDVDPVAV